MVQWLRLFEDMPNDPKWRVVAQRAARPICEVVAVFVHMLTNASASKTRGTLQNWDDEDVAVALDMKTADVTAIRDAMQGKVLDGDLLTGWKIRQPRREDGSAERSRAFREKRAQSNAAERISRSTNADELQEEKREEQKRQESSSSLRSEDSKHRPRRRISYDPAFNRFWAAYPRDSSMSKALAWVEWQKLEEDEKAEALRAVALFRKFCEGHPDYTPVHAQRYLSERRFEDHGDEDAPDESAGVWIKEGSRQWEEWTKHRGKRLPTNKNGQWHVRSEWPPGYCASQIEVNPENHAAAQHVNGRLEAEDR